MKKFSLQIKVPEALICVVASQIANLGESVIGASLQDKEGFRWVGGQSNYHLFLVLPILIGLSWLTFICWLHDDVF